MARRIAALAALALTITAVLAAAANAGTLRGYVVDPGSCNSDAVEFTAGPGERNHITLSGTDEIGVSNPLDFYETCPHAVSGLSFTDVTATIRPRGNCFLSLVVTNRYASCRFGPLTASLGDRNDTLVAGHVPTSVSCGPGRDVVIGTRTDAASDCETVLP